MTTATDLETPAKNEELLIAAKHYMSTASTDIGTNEKEVMPTKQVGINLVCTQYKNTSVKKKQAVNVSVELYNNNNSGKNKNTSVEKNR